MTGLACFVPVADREAIIAFIPPKTLAGWKRYASTAGWVFPLKEIATILANIGHTSASEILKRRLKNLEREITDLRRQQRCIVDILRQTELTKETEMISKEKWVAVMRAAGLSDDDMRNWHIQFEKMEPQGHQEFLESL